MAKETVAKYAGLARFLPMAKNGRVTLVNLDTFESKVTTQDQAIYALKNMKMADSEIWIMVRSAKGREIEES